MSVLPNRILNICCRALAIPALCCSFSAISQDVTSPRFFKVNVQRLSAPTRLISPEATSLKSPDKESNYLVDAELRFPIKLKGRTKLIGQIDYDREAVFGLYTLDENEGEDFNFHNLATALIGIHTVDDNWTYFTRFKLQNGAERLLPFQGRAVNSNFSNFLQKKTADGMIGFGFQLSYNRTLSVLPVFQLRKDLGSDWKLDISLPQQILVNKQFSKSHRWYAGLKGSRSNYLFQDELGGATTDIYYRRITANAVLGIEKQITPLFGLMVEAGATKPLRSAVYTFENGWRKHHDFNEGIEPYAKFGIFLSIDRSRLN